jgi:5-methylthioribose kinase
METNINIEDFSVLEDYLRARHYIVAEERVAFHKLLGGVSNRTVKVAWLDGRGWVLKQALSKLRVRADWFSDPERVRVEAKALQWLNRLALPGTTPAFLWEDQANHLLAMEAVPDGHQNWKSLLLSAQIHAEDFEQFGALLGTIHRRSSEAAAEVRPAFEVRTYFESLRLEPYYIYAAEKAPAAAGFLHALVRETRRHRLALVHGDFSPKNILIYQGRLILIDHEVVHFGDPAFDLGFALTHLLSKAHHLAEHRFRFADSAALFWHTYCKEVSGLNWINTLEQRAVRHTLGCLLARVAGKSRLEYLTATEALQQRQVVLSLMADPPMCIPTLINDFTKKIITYAHD